MDAHENFSIPYNDDKKFAARTVIAPDMSSEIQAMIAQLEAGDNRGGSLWRLPAQVFVGVALCCLFFIPSQTWPIYISPNWVFFSVFGVMCAVTTGAVMQKSIERIIGAVFGSLFPTAILFLIYYYIPPEDCLSCPPFFKAALVVLMLCVFTTICTHAALSYKQNYYIFLIAAGSMLTLVITNYDLDVTHMPITEVTSYKRIISFFSGSMVGLLVVNTLFPTHMRSHLRRQLGVVFGNAALIFNDLFLAYEERCFRPGSDARGAVSYEAITRLIQCVSDIEGTTLPACLGEMSRQPPHIFPAVLYANIIALSKRLAFVSLALFYPLDPGSSVLGLDFADGQKEPYDQLAKKAGAGPRCAHCRDELSELRALLCAAIAGALRFMDHRVSATELQARKHPRQLSHTGRWGPHMP
jgi:hypothetical protein